MFRTLSARPACSMAATESPPPTMVIAPPSVILASVSAIAYVPCDRTFYRCSPRLHQCTVATTPYKKASRLGKDQRCKTEGPAQGPSPKPVWL